MTEQKTTPPLPRNIEHCETMDDVRRNIDALDQELVALLATRQGYVQQAGRIKKEKNLVRDPARIQDVLEKVAESARAVGFNEDIARETWTAMIEGFIAFEHTIWDTQHGHDIES